ncbi:MAG TPA: MarR family transcriptional regulator [Chloroflexota bacterium]|nr:MarR family transcriptional regulator [Chloroflexota bacterium]
MGAGGDRPQSPPPGAPPEAPPGAPPEAPPDRRELMASLEREQRRAGAQGVLFGQAVADRLGINHTDMETLDLLRWAGPVTAGRLAELTGLTTGAVTRMIDRLERDGYVRREADAADRRRVIVGLVPEAVERVAPLYESLQRAVGALYERYSDAELATLLDHFSRLYAVMLQETARMRQQPLGASGAPGRFAAPLGRASAGQLRFPSGAFQVTLDVQEGMTDLLRARFEGPEPRFKVAGEVVTIDYRHSLFDRRERGGEVVLNGDVPWQLDIRSGASRLTAQLGTLRLRSLSLRGGASQVEVVLPRPQGTVPLSLAGGASAVSLLRPAGVPLRAHLRDAASDLTLDGRHYGTLARGWRWESDDFAPAADRYDLEITGGASSVTVDTR